MVEPVVVGLRPFAAGDLAELNRWYEKRRLSAVPGTMLPKLGLFAPGVAAGFLYRTDSSVALIDGLVTNPVAPLRVRREAVAAIVDGLRSLAKERGVSHLVAMTERRSTRRVAERAGFAAIGTYTMLGMEVR